MAKLLATIKAIITRLMFVAHGFIAIWQVTQFKKNPFYWYLSVPMILLFFEGIFTLTIKKNQEWKWFCPSVFLYLGSVVPAIWLLELDKVERRMRAKEESFNITTTADFKELHNLLGDKLRLPEVNISTEMWVTLIEQFLMLILIIGRWMLPKGDLTRDQLSQLLLVYIGTAADIIEFFDSFKDDKIASEPVLVLLTLSIWSWSLMQFTVVLTATKSRKSRLSTTSVTKDAHSCCCNIDVWGILLNITLQDAPFLAFRLLIILQFQIISYMNVFFTCKNTLVIMLQLYRLYVVYNENKKKPVKKRAEDFELTNISIISNPNISTNKNSKPSGRKNVVSDKSSGNVKRFVVEESEETSENDELMEYEAKKHKKLRKLQNARKDTGYSTGSSHTSARMPMSPDEKHPQALSKKQVKRIESKRSKKQEESESEDGGKKKRSKQKKKDPEALSEESEEVSEVEEKKPTRKKNRSSKDLDEGKTKNKKSSHKKSGGSSESETSTE